MPDPRRAARQERHLLDRLIDGEATAWRELIDTHAALLHAVARRVFARYAFPATRDDIEDTVAEVWRNLLEHDLRLVHQCRERDNLLPALQVLARHRAIDLMRRRKVHAQPLNDYDAAAPQERENSDMPDSDEIRAALNLLPQRERTLVQLFFLQHKKYREIADITGIPQNSIGPTLSRALVRLRTLLQPTSTNAPRIPAPEYFTAGTDGSSK